jgi:phosphodiesterase/alkaline phosphatase D-like protein
MATDHAEEDPVRSSRYSSRFAISIGIALCLGACVERFDLGVGAFEVGPTSAILWTHVVPLDPERASITFAVELATDAQFTDPVRRRAVTARAANDFTARVSIRGLEPSTRYHYRFAAYDTDLEVLTSPTGSFRTAPAPDDPGDVRFVISGDSNLGYTAPLGLDFHVLSAAAAEDPDFFVYFGDTVYADTGILSSGDAFSLDEYREVHRRTRADPHLQALLASTATYTGWDDHEVHNDYAGETVDPEQFENGARAFFEYLPTRVNSQGRRYRIDRSVRWGRHVELFFIDGRQFRSAERFCNPDPIPDGPETPDTLFSPFEEDEHLAVMVDLLLGALAANLLLLPSDPECVSTLLADPGRTILGADQLDWLQSALLESTATFKIIVNNTPLSSLLVIPYDRWEGYPAERQTLLDFIAENLDPERVLVLTTDFHTNLAVRREEFTEVIVGPIGQQTFSDTVTELMPENLLPYKDSVFALFDGVVDLANGGPGALAGSEYDAFGYAVVEIFERAGEPHLRVTARGNRDYALGANDPADVVDLFSVELPASGPAPASGP